MLPAVVSDDEEDDVQHDGNNEESANEDIEASPTEPHVLETYDDDEWDQLLQSKDASQRIRRTARRLRYIG